MGVLTAVSAVSAGDELLRHAVAILVLGTEAEAAQWDGLCDMLQQRTDNPVSVVTLHQNNHYIKKQHPFGCLSSFTGSGLSICIACEKPSLHSLPELGSLLALVCIGVPVSLVMKRVL